VLVLQLRLAFACLQDPLQLQPSVHVAPLLLGSEATVEYVVDRV
jgi:hypothetical protein